VALKDRFPGSSEPEEGMVTRLTESQTSRIPSIAFLSAAIGSMVASAALQAKGNDGQAMVHCTVYFFDNLNRMI